MMILRPCRWILRWDHVFLKFYETCFPIKYSWTSITLRIEELWPSQWSTIGPPANRMLGFDEFALEDRSCAWCIHIPSVVEATKSVFPKFTSSSPLFLNKLKLSTLGSNNLLHASSCKHRNKLTLFLTSMAYMKVACHHHIGFWGSI